MTRQTAWPFTEYTPSEKEIENWERSLHNAVDQYEIHVAEYENSPFAGMWLNIGALLAIEELRDA